MAHTKRVVDDIEAGPHDRRAHSPRLFQRPSLLLWSVVVINVIYLAALLLPGDAGGDLVDVVVSEIAQALPVCVFWAVAARTRFRRWDVIFAAAGLTFSAAGDFSYSLAMNADGYLASPSLADVGYLLYYPLMLLALLALIRRQSGRLLPGVLLDSAVAALGAAAVLDVVLAPTISDAASGGSVLGSAIASAYPLFDLVLVAALVGIAASPRLEAGPRWIGLVGGLLLFAAADIVYALLDARGQYAAGTPLDAAWTIGIGLTAWWVDGIRRPVRAPRPNAKHRAIPLPALAVLAGLGVLLVATQRDVPAAAIVLAGATVLLASVPVMIRQAVLGRRVVGQEKVLQQLEDLDRVKNELLATVNHEMRTPLTSVRGYLDLVLDDTDAIPSPTLAMLRKVEANVDRLDDLVDAMGSMADLDTREGLSERMPVAAEPLVRRVCENLGRRAAEAGVRLDVEGAMPEGLTVSGDAELLARAITALLDNAIKFTPHNGSVRVDLGWVLTPRGEPEAVIGIVDTGMGIPADDLPLVFTRFYRASNAQRAAIRGAGLGLAIARAAIDAHGGVVTLESRLAGGTSVRVRLPGANPPHSGPVPDPGAGAALLTPT